MAKLNTGFFSAWAIVIFTLFLCISPQATLLHAQKTVKLRIDPAYARGGTVSQIFDSVRYIPLETTKESTFGDIENLQVSQHNFVFFDYSNKALFIFDHQGKFQGKITKLPLEKWAGDNNGQKVNNANEDWALRGFTLHPKNEHIYIVYDDKTKENNSCLAVFDSKGKLLENRKLPKFMQHLCSFDFQFLENGDALFATDLAADKKDIILDKHYFHIVRNFDTIAANLDQVDTTVAFPFRKYVYDNGDSHPANISIWNRSYDYNMLRVDSAGNIAQYRFLLPLRNTIDSAFYRDTALHSSWQKANDYFKDKKDIINSFQNVMECNMVLTFMMGNGYNFTDESNLIFSLKSGSLYKIKNIRPDSTNYFLPICSWGKPDAMNDGKIYFDVPSYQMFQAMESRDEKPWERDPVLKKYFTTENRKSNPVLVELKLKDNL